MFTLQKCRAKGTLPIDGCRKGVEWGNLDNRQQFRDNMKGLIIKEPWILKILSGEKTMEMRKTRTKNFGRIALLNRGFIRGFATLHRCDGPLSNEELLARSNEHCIPEDRINSPDYSYRFGWMISDVENLPIPKKYTHPRGAQMWVNLDDSEL